MSGDLVGALAILAAAFVFGCWYGLYLNLSHMHRMRRWACAVADRVGNAQDKIRELERKGMA